MLLGTHPGGTHPWQNPGSVQAGDITLVPGSNSMAAAVQPGYGMTYEDMHDRQMTAFQFFLETNAQMQKEMAYMLKDVVSAPIHMAVGFAHHAGQRAYNAVVEKARSLSPFGRRQRSVPNHAAPLLLDMQHGEVGTSNAFPRQLHLGPQEPGQYYMGTPRVEEESSTEPEYPASPPNPPAPGISTKPAKQMGSNIDQSTSSSSSAASPPKPTNPPPSATQRKPSTEPGRYARDQHKKKTSDYWMKERKATIIENIRLRNPRHTTAKLNDMRKPELAAMLSDMLKHG